MGTVTIVAPLTITDFIKCHKLLVYIYSRQILGSNLDQNAVVFPIYSRK